MKTKQRKNIKKTGPIPQLVQQQHQETEEGPGFTWVSAFILNTL